MPRLQVHRFAAALFSVGLAAILAIVVALPVFPSGDGPVHIYLSHILLLLAARPTSASGQLYASTYFIRHLVQPYSLHYFWLIGVEHFATVAIAEKSFIVAILLANALGFLFLASQLCRSAVSSARFTSSTSACSVAAWILPLLLSWALGAGFLNFCFAAGTMFFAYALYLQVLAARQAARSAAAPIAGYIAALVLLVLSHPVPLLILLGLLTGDLLLLLLQKRRAPATQARPWFPGLLLALIAFVFPMLIADKAQVADSLLRDLRPHTSQLAAIAAGYRLSMFFSGSAAGIVFSALLVALVPVTLTLMVRSGWLKRLRSSQSTPADRLCLSATLLLLATIVFPQSMNGSALFADRMIPLLWPLIFVCLASLPLSPMLLSINTVCATGATAISVLFAISFLLPVARQQQALTQAPIPAFARGLFLTPPIAVHPYPAHFADTLLDWGGARAFAAHNDILLNTPWMQLTIVPIGERGHSGLLRDRLPGSLSESPAALSALLASQSPQRQQALARADFLLYSDPGASAAALRTALPTYLQADSAHWPCTVYGFYAVCVRDTYKPQAADAH